MNNPHSSLWGQFQEKWLSRRGLIRGAAGTVLGAGLAVPKLVFAREEDDDRENGCVGPNAIPGGIPSPFAPSGIFIHHNPLNPAKPLANISDPSQITDFDGFVGLTHIRGGGTDMGGNRLAFQADMGFSQGKFIGTDGQQHRGTFAFV